MECRPQPDAGGDTTRGKEQGYAERKNAGRGPDAGFVLEHARDHHDHNASNHSRSNGPAPDRDAHDNYDAHGRRLLIVKARRNSTALWAAFAFKSSTEFHQPQVCIPDGFVRGRTDECSRECRSGFLTWRFCALGFLFLYLTDYGGDRLKLLAIAEVH